MSFQHKVTLAQPVRRKPAAGTVLGSNGRPMQAVTVSGSRSLAQKIASVNRSREQLNPLQGLNLGRAVDLASAYFRGEMADLQWAYFFIEQTDPDLLALMELRLGRLVEMDYNISVEEDAEKNLAAEQSDYLEEKFSAIDNLYDAIEHFGYAPFRGFSHCEKWTERGEVVHLEVVDQWNTVRDGLVGAWKYNPEARTTSFRALSDALLMPPENFVFRQVRRPINRIALYKFVRDNLANVDWDSFNAIFGIPSGVVTGPPDVPEDREEEYESAANEIAEGGSGYLPYGATYTQNKAPGGTNPFKERLEYLSQKLVLAGTGGKLTMLTEAGSGTLAGGAHSDVFDAIVSADARRISEVFNRQLVKAWLNAEFPGQKQLAYFGLAANEETDVSQIITDFKTLSDAGFQVDPAEASAKTGYTLTLKVVAPAFGAPGGDPSGSIVNRASASIAAGKEARFLSSAEQQLAAADLAVLAPVIALVGPIRAELARLADLPDDAAFSAGLEALQPALRKFQAALPALEEAVLKGRPDLDDAFSDIIATAFRSGLEEAADSRAKAAPKSPKPPSPPSRGQSRRA